MKNIIYGVLGFIGFIALILALDYGLGLQWFGFIEPKKENVRREIFINTRSYVEGKTQDLVKYRLEYYQADNEGKKIIANTIRHAFAEFDENKLNSIELKNFLKEIKYGVK